MRIASTSSLGSNRRSRATLIVAALTAAAVAAAGCSQGGGGNRDCTGVDKCDDLSDQEFEYIVVGSGAGGGPLASRLARAGHKVLLLEAGEDMASKLEYQIPVMHANSTEEPGLAWHYYVKHYSDPTDQKKDSKFSCRDPQTGSIALCEMQNDGQCECPATHPEELGILYPRGGTLGGSTAVNAMITVLPQNSDWDGIAELTGDDSWSAANMAKYFDRVKEWLHVQKPDAGIGISDLKVLVILVAAVVEFVKNGWTDGPSLDLLNIVGNTTQMLNILTKDLNDQIIRGKNPVGMWSFPLAVDGHKRNGTREFILDTVEQGFPLTVKTSALVTNVVYADEPGPNGEPKVVGVDYLDGGHLYKADLMFNPNAARQQRTVTATREVVLSAGAFNTPQLLKLSGIGPKEELAEHGIDVVADRPGVGENLQDRYEVGVVAELASDFGVIEDCTFEANEDDPCFRDWERKKGVYTTNGAITSMLMKSSAEKTDPDLHIFGVPGVFAGYYPGYSSDALLSKQLFTWVILKGHTENRAGTVKLRSADPTDWPDINFRYFDEGDTGKGESEADVNAVVNAIEFIRGVIEKSDTLLILSGFKETWPAGGAETREELANFVKHEAWGHHASCSAAIGADSDPKAVLDSKFRVRGVSGLRVVDASVFPRIPGTFIVLPTYMVSEKAADTILEDAR